MVDDRALPSDIDALIDGVQVIFLSVTPVNLLSEGLDTLSTHIPGDVDVVSADKTFNTSFQDTVTTIVVCGDIPLEVLPSFLEDKVSGDVTRWVALRLYNMDSNGSLCDFISSEYDEGEYFTKLTWPMAINREISRKGVIKLMSQDEIGAPLSNKIAPDNDLEFIE